MGFPLSIPQPPSVPSYTHFGLSLDDLNYALDHGDIVIRDGHELVTLTFQNIPQKDRRNRRYLRLEGLEVTISSGNGRVLRVSRNQNTSRRQPYKRHQRRGQLKLFQYA